MAVIAKFRCNGYQVAKDWKGRMVRTVEFIPVSADEKCPENKKFWDATPTGKLELGMVFEEAVKQFDIDQEYYVIITKTKPPGI